MVAGPEIGGGEGTAEESPPAGRVTDETDYFRIVDHSSRTLASSIVVNRRGLSCPMHRLLIIRESGSAVTPERHDCTLDV